MQANTFKTAVVLSALATLVVACTEGDDSVADELDEVAESEQGHRSRFPSDHS